MINISQDERQRAIMMSRRKYETDRMSDLLNAKEEGENEGRMAERLAMAAKMKDKGIDINTIMEVTNLSVDEILKA